MIFSLALVLASIYGLGFLVVKYWLPGSPTTAEALRWPLELYKGKK